MAKWDNLLLFKKNSAEDYLKTAQALAFSTYSFMRQPMINSIWMKP